MALDTTMTFVAELIFSLPSKTDRVALETQIDTFLATQPPEARAVNQIRDDPDDANVPHWFRSRMSIPVGTLAEVVTLVSTLETAIEAMPTLLHYRSELHRELALSE